ncbi:ubiquitin-conjugating enzyme, putative [Leishmania tarentolae]|uniref:Ubiquitin-conjugating enzyme, putative n=1 Tax=Leishmania tarentolae TaxID=5689 RepID=A0A640K842_LEITA|nr:ubiquitin-conjugating enzyme, putative [Leishmania tarentolae]
MSYASSAIKRLSNEHRRLQKPENRVREYYVAPLEDNIFEWHFTLRGPGGDDNSLPYKDGIYHGALIFSRSYPLEPPDILFFTRSGRFSVHEKICSTISSYHKELWQPTYDIALTLTALRHFMAQEDEVGVGSFPKNRVAFETKEAWAKETWAFKCSTCGVAMRDVWETEMKMYPEISPEKEAQVPKLPPTLAAAAAHATAELGDANAPQDTPPLSASPSSTGSPPPDAAPGAPQDHKAPKDTQPVPAMAPSAPTPPPLGATPTPLPAAADVLRVTAVEANALHSSASGVHGALQTPRPASQEHTATRDTPVKEEMGKDGDALTYCMDVSPARVVPAPVMTAPPPPPAAAAEPDSLYNRRLEPLVHDTLQGEVGNTSAAAATDATPRVSNDVADGVVEAEVTRMSVAPPSETAAATVAPPQFAQRAVFCVSVVEVSIPLHLLDRAIVISFFIVVLILLRRGLCSLLLS